MNAPSSHSLIALGLDGGDWDFINRHRMDLPVIDRLLDSQYVWQTGAPTALSGSVWPTFYNGQPPGVHGVYQHLVWDPARMGVRRIAPDWCYYQPFWASLERHGLKMAVIDVPYSFPGTLRHGLEITDWATHGQTWPMVCTNESLRGFLTGMGKNPIGRETPVRKSPVQLDRIRRDLVASAGLKARLVREVLSQQDPDVLLVVFGETHRGGHVLFPSTADADGGIKATALLDVYQAVDRALGHVLAADSAGSANVLLFSVQGMNRDNAQGHLVRPLMERINQKFLAANNLRGESRRNKAWIKALRSGLPPWFQLLAGTVASDPLRQWVVERELVGGLQWNGTPGFALRTDIRTELRLNLSGREAQGMLKPGSDLHIRYVEWLTRCFMELCDASTGQRLVDEVVQIADMYPGPRNALLPDLVIKWQQCPPASRASSPLIGEVSARPLDARGADHTDEGFLALKPALAADIRVPEAPRRTEDFAKFITELAIG